MRIMLDIIVFIATAWGARYGGINSFNEDLCTSIAKLTRNKYRIYCVVLSANQDEVLSAKQKGVDLIILDKSKINDTMETHRVHEIVNKVEELNSGKVLFWIGHDVITGPLAIEASKLSDSGKSGVIHHMNYEVYEAYKPYNKNAAEKIKLQREVLSKAHIVFAIGPKLRDSANEKLRGRSSTKIVELIPGLAEIEGLDPPDTFSAITLGRLDSQNDRVKQTSLVVAAFGHVKKRQPDPLGLDSNLKIIGLSEDNQEKEYREMLDLAESRANRAVLINGQPYMENRAELFEIIRRHSVCLMLSLHEGFGLVGWESIAAEVPLIVSKNSGLYQIIQKSIGGMGTGCIRGIDLMGSVGEIPYKEVDVENVAKALIDI